MWSFVVSARIKRPHRMIWVAVEAQQLVMGTATFHKALQGEVRRDSDGNLPVEYLAAVELLRNTRWKQKAGGHKQFGAS